MHQQMRQVSEKFTEKKVHKMTRKEWGWGEGRGGRRVFEGRGGRGGGSETAAVIFSLLPAAVITAVDPPLRALQTQATRLGLDRRQRACV